MDHTSTIVLDSSEKQKNSNHSSPTPPTLRRSPTRREMMMEGFPLHVPNRCLLALPHNQRCANGGCSTTKPILLHPPNWLERRGEAKEDGFFRILCRASGHAEKGWKAGHGCVELLTGELVVLS
ncbi:hypothetical protein BLNAU_8695 [Blattamonas nauphoetae]|uniref:Uncharacterized protein n=1 Tax=Blattamonas nauphoetae TaxID=2049346 RepID=A0ABQ9XXV5_9EUKA|nr:hypothetical protein BLNAU_8695 [Blattamonas nauphoetae]